MATIGTPQALSSIESLIAANSLMTMGDGFVYAGQTGHEGSTFLEIASPILAPNGSIASSVSDGVLDFGDSRYFLAPVHPLSSNCFQILNLKGSFTPIERAVNAIVSAKAGLIERSFQAHPTLSATNATIHSYESGVDSLVFCNIYELLQKVFPNEPAELFDPVNNMQLLPTVVLMEAACRTFGLGDPERAEYAHLVSKLWLRESAHPNHFEMDRPDFSLNVLEASRGLWYEFSLPIAQRNMMTISVLYDRLAKLWKIASIYGWGSNFGKELAPQLSILSFLAFLESPSQSVALSQFKGRNADFVSAQRRLQEVSGGINPISCEVHSGKVQLATSSV